MTPPTRIVVSGEVGRTRINNGQKQTYQMGVTRDGIPVFEWQDDPALGGNGPAILMAVLIFGGLILPALLLLAQ